MKEKVNSHNDYLFFLLFFFFDDLLCIISLGEKNENY